MHRTKDTYPLSHLRQHMKDHLARVRDGAVETITQNGEAALVVMSPETYDSMVHLLQRGSIWDQGIDRIEHEGKGERPSASRT